MLFILLIVCFDELKFFIWKTFIVLIIFMVHVFCVLRKKSFPQQHHEDIILCLFLEGHRSVLILFIIYLKLILVLECITGEDCPLIYIFI